MKGGELKDPEPKLRTEVVPISILSEDPANVRSHSPRNIEAIKASLRRFGQQKPIVVSEHDVVVAGNGTLRAARELGWETVEVVRTALAGADAVAFAIADNRTAELAEWDYGELAKLLGELDLSFVEEMDLTSILSSLSTEQQEDESAGEAVPYDAVTVKVFDQTLTLDVRAKVNAALSDLIETGKCEVA